MIKLSSLRDVLYSTRGYVQMAVIYDDVNDEDIDEGTVEGIIDAYGDYPIKHIEAWKDTLVFTIAQ